MLVFLCPKGTLTELRVAMVVAGINYSRKTTTTTTPCCCLRFCYCIVIVCLLSFILLCCGFWRGDHAASTSKTNGLFSGQDLNLEKGKRGKAGGGTSLCVPAKNLSPTQSTQNST